MSEFKHFACFLCSPVNKVLILEICMLLHSVFGYILHNEAILGGNSGCNKVRTEGIFTIAYCHQAGMRAAWTPEFVNAITQEQGDVESQS